MDFAVFLLLSLDLDFAVSLASHCLPLALLLHRFVFDFHLSLDIEGFRSPLAGEHLLAFSKTFISVGIVLLFFLLF